MLRWLHPGHWTYHRLAYGYGEWERDDGLTVKEAPSYSSASYQFYKVFRHYEISHPVHGPVDWAAHKFHMAVCQNNEEHDGVCLPPYVEPLYHPELH